MYGNVFYQPAPRLGLLREAMNDLFSGVSGAVHEFPAVNVYANDNGAVVKAELPGVSLEQLEITVENNSLTLKGNRNNEDVKDDGRVLRRERLHGDFTRSFNVPFRVDSAQVTAKLDRGVLTVNLPRAESDKPRKINIASV